MQKHIILYLAFPVLFGVILSGYKRELIRLFKYKFYPQFAHNELFISVISGRNHFDKRQAIRRTWWEHIKNNKTLSEDVDLKFIIGMPCLVPPDDRNDPYTCVENDETVVISNDEFSALIEDNTVEQFPNSSTITVQSLPFRVLHPIVLRKLGIYYGSAAAEVSLKLLDAATQEVVVSTTLSMNSSNNHSGGFLYQEIEPYILPKGFEGIVIGEDLAGSQTTLPVQEHTRNIRKYGNGVISFIDITPTADGFYLDPKAWGSKSITIVSFNYTIHEVSKLKKHKDSSKIRRHMWEIQIAQEENRIQEEINEYDDVTIVDVLDVYRNIPNKLLKLFSWLNSHSSVNSFNYLLKTDDDCFLDVENVMEQLRKFNVKSKFWWGRFRHNWVVEHYGKWAERRYPSPVYPKFACGVGYVLSSDLIIWLAENSQNLQIFQGEDVSMGIWLASLGPNYVDDPLWQCEKDCTSEMRAMPELLPRELEELWANRLLCDDPCGCSE